jgi:hypothetical protein
MEHQWFTLKDKLDQFYMNGEDMYRGEDPNFIVDVYFKKYIVAMQDILIEEDE